MKQILHTCILLLLFLTPAYAQEDTCEEQVTQAITTAVQSCDGIASNEICFGHGAIDLIVNCDSVPDFKAPGDLIPLEATCALRSSAMSSSSGWGIALMNVPVHDSDISLAYTLLGDVEIQNAASSRSEVRVWLDRDVEIRSGPGSNYSAIETLPVGSVIYANACNCTRNWLRTVLENGQVGWVSAHYSTIIGDIEDFPIAEADSPLYGSMQAFNFESSPDQPDCPSAPENGILLQTPDNTNQIPTQINGVEIGWTNATAFLQSQPDGNLTIDLLNGAAQVTANNHTMRLTTGMRITIPMSDSNLPLDGVTIEPYASEDIMNLPVSLLPCTLNLTSAVADDIPHLVGQETCDVVSGRNDTVCPIHFVNADGDTITDMDVQFVYAPQGDWTSKERENPTLIEGDNLSGKLAWDVSCFLGSANFIGPVVWSVTITDEMGHTSDPLEVSFNCVDG